MEKKVELTLEAETKGTFRFKELDEQQPVLRTLYVQKTAFPNKVPPKTITVSLSWNE